MAEKKWVTGVITLALLIKGPQYNSIYNDRFKAHVVEPL